MIHDRLAPVAHKVDAYTARCSCGWTSPGWPTHAGAEDILRRHIEAHPEDEQGAVNFS